MTQRAQRGSRRGQRGNATLLGALMLTLALGLFALITDGGLLYASKSRLETYAQEIARAGATAVDLNGVTGSGTATLDMALAAQQAEQYFQGLNLGPTYSMTIKTLTPTLITIQMSHDQPVYLIAAFVPLHSVSIVVEASAVPKVGF
jgi:Flp pilus assembly protein TadG